MWVRRIRRRRKNPGQISKQYVLHKETARVFVQERIEIINAHYNHSFNRIAIRDQKTRWGSCSAKGNLNFNYRIQFLPLHLADYIVAHELCHLKEFNHGAGFWALVEEAIPEYRAHKAELQKVRMTRGVVS